MLRVLLKVSLMLSLLFSTPLPASAQGTTNLFYVRHAESLGNVTHNHSKYNDRTLSEKGRLQAENLARRLNGYHIDHIIVSPKHRALKTILPYLKQHGLVAEIWPALDECCWQKQRNDGNSSRPGQGERIDIDAGMKAYFSFPYGKYEYKTRSYGQGIFQLLKATDLIKRRFGGSGKNILLVGHYHAGSRLFELLQGLEPEGRYKLKNTGINQLSETDDGNFRIVSFDR